MPVFQHLVETPAVHLSFAALLGLIIGSFLNVVIHRLPKMLEREWRTHCAELASDAMPVEAEGEVRIETDDKVESEPYNLVVPRSRCPGCGHHITALENIPVVSYLWLRGRCSACGRSISMRYPVVELLCALLSLIVIWRFGVTAQGAGALLLTWVLVALAFIDFDTQYLPDSLTLPFLWVGLVLNLGAVYVPLADAVIGAVAGYGVLWLVYQLFKLLTGKEGMGYGDFKLLAMLGAWMGWQVLPIIVVLSSAVGAVIGIGLIALRKHDKNIPIPFGPYLAVAGWLALLWGNEMLTAYLRFTGVPG